MADKKPVGKTAKASRKKSSVDKALRLLQDQYPTQYMPEVGRQVMQAGGTTGEPMALEDILALIRSGGAELGEFDPRIPSLGKRPFQAPGSKFTNQALPLQRPYVEPTEAGIAAPMPPRRPVEFNQPPILARDRAPYRFSSSPFASEQAEFNPPPILARDRAPYRLSSSPFASEKIEPSNQPPILARDRAPYRFSSSPFDLEQVEPSNQPPILARDRAPYRFSSSPFDLEQRVSNPTEAVASYRPPTIQGQPTIPMPPSRPQGIGFPVPLPPSRPADNIPMPPSRPRSFDAAPAVQGSATQAPDDNVSRALWAAYSESQSPADFFRADEAMREGRAGGGKAVSKALKAVSEMFDSPGMSQWREGSKIPASRVEDRYFTGTSKDKDFANFNVGRHGSWFTKDPADASMYARENDSRNLRYNPDTRRYDEVNSADRVIPAFLRSENPFTGPLPDMARAENYKKAQSDWFDTLRAQGYDAWMPESDPNLAVILSDPSNIKSAISNTGDFDRASPRVDRAEGGGVGSDDDIRQYERAMAAIARQPEDIRSMTHGPSIPMRPIEIEGGFTGKRQLGSAPYNVAGPLSTSAQLAYDMKSLPFYFTPAAPVALASDTGEAAINMAKSIRGGDYLGAGIEGALGVAPGAATFRKPIGKALGVARDALGRVPAPVAAGAAGAAVMAPEDAEAGFFGTLARMSAKERQALDLARAALPKGATPAQTWRDYGWAPSPSGSMMSEYSDEAARLLPGGAQMFRQGVNLPAGLLIEHPEMFGRYPSHFSTQVQSLDPASVPKGQRGWYDHYRDIAATNRGMTDDEIIDNILHEVGGHRTQKIEGHSAGTSPSAFRGPDTWEIEQSIEQIEGAKALQKYLAENPGATLGDALFDLKKMGVELPSGASTYARTPDLDVLSAQKRAQLEKVKSSAPSAYEQYFRSEGEVNARLPGERRGMSESQRRENFPWQNPNRIFVRDPYQSTGVNPDDPAWNATQAAIDFARKLGKKGGGSVGLLDSVSPSAIMSNDGRDAYQAGGVIRKALGLLKPAGSGYKSVPGKPETVNIPGFGKVEARPVPEIEKAAADYMKSIGRPGEHTVSEFKPLNEEYAARVADAFERMKHSPGDPEVRRSYEALMDETMAQYRAAKDTGIDFKFMKEGQADPYAASPALGYEDIVNRGRLWVYPTEQGFGSTDSIVASNPLVKGAGRVGDKPDAVINDAFRVIHDLYGHYGPGNPFFRAPGEERAYQLHSRMFSPEALPAATAETRGQNSWVNYGPYGEANRRALGSETIFADQKTGMMPSWTSAEPPPIGGDVDAYIRSLEGRAEGGAVNREEPGIVDRAMSFLSQFNPVGSAEASPFDALIKPAISAARKYGKSTVTDPSRMAYPGIYENPKAIAAEAARRVAPEDPAMKEIFGVNRDDLFEMSKGRVGNMEPELAFKPNARGSAAAERIMNRKNENRLVDILAEAQKQTELSKGMVPWYIMDPAYQLMVRARGKEAADAAFSRFNTVSGMMSPGSEVTTELNRGSAANYLMQQGRGQDFIKYGGQGQGGKSPRGADFPEDIRAMVSHPYHSTSHGVPLEKYMGSGRVEMQSPKVPTYIPASSVPELGFQTRWAVPDAHFTRGVGMSDARTAPKTFQQSMSMAEYQDVAPWWRDRVARRVGMEPVPAQALIWGGLGHATGVDTAIGAPKIELLAKQIMQSARRHNMDPKKAAERVLFGDQFNRGGSVS